MSFQTGVFRMTKAPKTALYVMKWHFGCFLKPSLPVSQKDRKLMISNMFPKQSRYGFGRHIAVMIASNEK